MQTITASAARQNLYQLVNREAGAAPILITGKRQQAVLISAEDWRAIEETLFLLSVPGMRESLIADRDTPLADLLDEDQIDL